MEDDEWFCGNLTMAARRLQIDLRETNEAGSFCFIWHDKTNSSMFGGLSKPTRKEALYSACQQLNTYLNA